MSLPLKSFACLGLVAAATLLVAACSPHKVPALTVADLMEDRVTLDSVLIRCSQNPASSENGIECVNARIAAERLDSQRLSNGEDVAKRAAAFEQRREQLRQQQDKQRQEQEEAKAKLDGYHLPVVPTEEAPPPKDPQSPIVGKANP